MDVRIGVTYTPKEIELELDDADGDRLVKDVEAAMAKKDGAVLWITDRKGRRVGVPAEKIAYVEIGASAEGHKVGFGL